MVSPAPRAGVTAGRAHATMDAMRASRLALSAVALGAALIGLSGCTSTSYSCSDGSCSITLKGEGASTEIDPLSLGLTTSGEVIFELEQANEGAATFAVDGTRNECATGETILVGQVSVTCTEITEGTLKLTARAD